MADGAAIPSTRARFQRAFSHIEQLQELLLELANEHNTCQSAVGQSMWQINAAGLGDSSGLQMFAATHNSYPSGHSDEGGAMVDTIMSFQQSPMPSLGRAGPGVPPHYSIGLQGLAYTRNMSPVGSAFAVAKTDGSPLRQSTASCAICGGMSDAHAAHGHGPQCHPTLQPHIVFARGQGPQSSVRRGSSASNNSTTSKPVPLRSSSGLSSQDGGYSRHKSDAGWQALHPDTIAMTVWKALGICALLWDWFTVPWLIAFYEDKHADMWIHWVGYASKLYWTIDIPVLAVTASYNQHHNIVRDVKQAGLKYLKSWFLFDVTILTLDWFFSLLGKNGASLVAGLAPLALLRAMRHSQRFVIVNEQLQMMLWERGVGQNFLTGKILLILLFLCLFNHIISCTWYTIGKMENPDKSSLTWLTYIDEDGRDDRRYVYFTALHWSFTQFLPGSMEVFPKRFLERFFNVVVLVGGWLVILTSTAVLTSIMTQQRLRIEQGQERRLQLLKYLHQENVDHVLAICIRRHLKARGPEKSLLKAKDVQDLALLPKSLRRELSLVVHGQRLRNNSFFSIIEALDAAVYTSICHSGIEAAYHKADDLVFEEGQEGGAIGFVNHGSLSYFSAGSVAHAVREREAQVSVGGFFSEIALWVQWSYLGVMTSVEYSELLHVSATSLASQLKRNPEAWVITQDFCESVARCYEADGSRAWSDLELAVDHADVIGGMPRKSRADIGDALLDVVTQHSNWKFVNKLFAGSGLAKLREEISSGACFVSWHSHEVFRTVFVVALRLRRKSDSLLLAKIGELTDEGEVTKATCQLPGTKRKEQEEAWEAVQRLLQQEMSPIAPHTQLPRDDVEFSEMTQESEKYGIRSRYMKTTFNAVVENERALPTYPIMENWLVKKASSMQSVRAAFTQSLSLQAPRRKSILRRLTGCYSSQKSGVNAHGRSSVNSNVEKDRVGWTLSSYSASEISPVSEILQEATEVVIVPGRKGGKEVYLWVTDRDFELMQTQRAATACLEKFLKEALPSVAIMEGTPSVEATESHHCGTQGRISNV